VIDLGNKYLSEKVKRKNGTSELLGGISARSEFLELRKNLK
jgi:hypothetical protein